MSPTATPRRTRVTALLALLWVAWVLVPIGLVLASIGTVLTFLGDLPTPAERAQADRLLVAAVVVAVAVPLLGVLVSVCSDRRASAAAFGVALALGLVAAVPVAEDLAPEPAAPQQSGGGCQEHSGGDTRCPGG
jgi:hypothetical protein